MTNVINRPTWVEIDLDHLKNNIEEVRRVTDKNALVTAVIKADAYGHGALKVIDTLLENGADRLAVAALNEALEIREKYSEVPILILGYTPDEGIEKVIKNNIIQTVYSEEQVAHISETAKKLGKEAVLHIKIDTGMRRLGFNWEDYNKILSIFEYEHVKFEGIYTHFAKADEKDKAFTIKQFNRFNLVINELEKNKIKVPIKHVSNSAAIIDLPEFSYDMVRAGIMLYGVYPSEEVGRDNVNLKPVMTFKTRVGHVKYVDENEGVSYGLIYKADRHMKVATLPVGYADGYSRLLTSKAEVLIKSSRRKVIGRICMDQLMIDLGKSKAQVGDEVVLFGYNEKEELSVDEVAKWLDTINYEVLCMISRRVPRVYIESGEIVDTIDYLD
ncbi:MAG TPA: alanine racemase [Clostridia bacterium]|nr:alanine racemase [Clostridia bacterium]